MTQGVSIAAQSLTAQDLLDVPVRVHAELGRAKLPLAQAIGMPDGAIVDLDRSPEEPVDVYVNGKPFGTGRLVVVDGEWAIRLESVFDPQAAV